MAESSNQEPNRGIVHPNYLPGDPDEKTLPGSGLPPDPLTPKTLAARRSGAHPRAQIVEEMERLSHSEQTESDDAPTLIYGTDGEMHRWTDTDDRFEIMPSVKPKVLSGTEAAKPIEHERVDDDTPAMIIDKNGKLIRANE